MISYAKNDLKIWKIRINSIHIPYKFFYNLILVNYFQLLQTDINLTKRWMAYQTNSLPHLLSSPSSTLSSTLQFSYF